MQKEDVAFIEVCAPHQNPITGGGPGGSMS